MFTQTSHRRVLFLRKLWPLVLLVLGVATLLYTSFVLPSQKAIAATDSTINFQARLLTASGTIVPDGNYNIEFKLYNTLSPGGGHTEDQGACTYNGGTPDPNCLWVETRTSGNVVAVKDGYLTVSLGSVTSFPTTINWDQDLYLTMNIGGTGGSPTWDGEMAPRIHLTAIPYAFRAGSLANLSSGGYTSTLAFASGILQNTTITLPDPGASTATVCYQAASACGFATGSGVAILQGGNTFSGTTAANIGTLNNGALDFTTDNGDRLNLDTSGNLQFQQASTVNILAASSGTQLTIQGGAANSGTNAGGNLLLQGGAGNSTGLPGSVVVKANTNDSSTAFVVQNAAGHQVLGVNTNTNNVSVQGSELFTGGSQTFGAQTNWTITLNSGGATVTAAHTSGSALAITASPALSISNGVTYQVTYVLTGNTNNGTIQATVGGVNGTLVSATSTTNVDLITATGTGNLTFTPSSNFNGTITGVSVIPVTTLANAVLTIGNSNGVAGIELRAGGNGDTNTLVGLSSGEYNTTGTADTALGAFALESNTTGASDVAIGPTALYDNTTGNGNIAIGGAALRFNTVGLDNTATGLNTLFNNSTGSSNTANGFDAGRSIISGSGDTLLGYFAGYEDPNDTSFVTGSNVLDSTAIGYGAQVQENKAIVLGGIGSTSSNIQPNIGIGTTSPDNLFSVSPDIYDTGTASMSASSTVVGSGTTWTANMVGDDFIFADGDKYTVVTFTDSTHLVLSASATESSQAYRIQNPAFYVSSTGSVESRTSTNSTTAFQLQGASGQNLLTLNDTTGNNLVVNSGFETGSADWVSKGTSAVSQEQGNTIVYNSGTAGTSGSSTTTITGSSTAWTSSLVGDIFEFADGQGATITGWTSGTSLTIATAVNEAGTGNKYQIVSPSALDGSGDLKAVATAATSGMQTSTFNSSILPSTQYQLTFWAMCSASMATFTYGRQDISGTDVNSSTAATCNTYWTQYTTHFTTGGTITNPNIYFDSGSTTSVGIYIDDVSLVQTTNTGPNAYTAGSANALQLQNSSGANVLTANTASMRVGVDATYTALSAPSGLAAAAGGTGTLSGTYYYKITAIDSVGGESLPSSEVSAAPSSQGVILTWNTDIGASGYNIYRSTSSGAEVYLTTITGTFSSTTQLTYADNGSLTAGTANPPATNSAYVSASTSQANGQLAIGGNGTPTGQLYVSGTVPSAALSTTTTSGINPDGMVVQGRYGYTLSYFNANLQIFDFSNPAAPTSVSVTTTQTHPRSVAVQGDYAYVDEWSPAKMQIFNISNPAAPYSVSSISAGAHPTWITVSGRYAYMVNDTSLLVFDISNPAAPVQVGSTTNHYSSSGQNQVYVQGHYAYVDSQNDLNIYDISDPTAPTFVGQVSSANADGLAVQGRYAYVTNNNGNELNVIDVSNPAAPVTVGSLVTNISPSGISVQGRYAYLADGSGAATGTLQTIDISNPASPFVVGSVNTLEAPGQIAVQGRYAYVNDYWAQAVQVFDLGGTYDQQLQAGGAEVGTLQVDTNANVYGDEAVEGGLTVGTSAQVAGNATLGGLTINGLATAGAPTVANGGTATNNGVTYTYEIVAFNNSGTSPASATGTNSGGPTSLSSSGYETVSWTAVTGATGYNIYRTVGGGSTGLIGTVYGTTVTFNDTGLTGDSSTAPTVNTAGALTAQGTALFEDSTNSTTAFQVQSAGGTSILDVDTTDSRVGINTGTATPSADLSFGSNGSTARAINVLTPTTNAVGTPLTISAGSAGAGVSAFAGGALTLQGGAAGGTGNANGGNVVLEPGAGDGTGSGGIVSIENSAGSAEFDFNGNSTATLTCGALTTSSSNPCKIQAGLTLTLTSNNNTGTIFKNGGDVAGAVQVQNAAGNESALSVGTVNDAANNFITNSTFENLAANGNPVAPGPWVTKGSGNANISRTGTAFSGSEAMSIATTSGASAGDGAKDVITLDDSTTYTLAFYAKLSSGSMTTLGAGYSSDGATDTDCTLNSNTLSTSIWTRYTCTFTTPSSHSGSPFIYIKQTDAGVAHTYFVDNAYLELGSSVEETNFINNPSFESSTSGWSGRGSGTIAQAASQQLYGSYSGKVTTTATANDGTEFSLNLTSSTPYTFSFYAMTTGSSFTVQLGRSDNGTTGGETNCTTGTVTSTWTRFSCTFTTGTVSSTPYVYITQSSATARSFYVDGVRLDEGSTLYPYSDGTIQLGGVVTSQTAFQSVVNTTTAFQVQNAGGENVLSVDTSGGNVILGALGTGGVQGSLVFNNNASGATHTVTLAAPTSDATSSYTLNLPIAAPSTSQCLESGSSTAAQLIFTSCGGGGSETLQQAYNFSAAAAPSIDLYTGSASTALTIQNDNSHPITGELFGVHDKTASGLGTGLFTVANTGNTLVHTNSATSTSTFQVQNSSNVQVLNVDAQDSEVQVQGINSVAVIGATDITLDNTFNGAHWTHGTGWTVGSSTATASAATGTVASTVNVIGNDYYELLFTIGSYTAGGLTPSIGATNGQEIFGNGTYTQYIPATNNNPLTFTPDATNHFSGILSSVDVYLITASNPVLQVLNSGGSTGVEIRAGGGGGHSPTFEGINAGEYDTLSGGGYADTAFGNSALQYNINGISNVAVGDSALQYNNTGGANNAIGVAALQFNTSGSNNNAIGENALQNNTTGTANVAIGQSALAANLSGDDNAAIGYATLSSNTTGNYNTASGYNALGDNTTGYNNSAFGSAALESNTTGGYNTAVGQFALGSNITGSDDTALGYDAGFQDYYGDGFNTIDGLSNSTALGFSSQVQESNALVLGAEGVEQTNVGIGTTSPDNTFSVSPDIYDTGTVCQGNTSACNTSGTNIFQSGGSGFTANMVGDDIIFADGTKYTITAYVSSTELTASGAPSTTHAATAYRIQNPAFYVTNTGSVESRSSTNSTTAFQVQNASGTSLLDVDTTNTQTNFIGNVNLGTAVNTGGAGRIFSDDFESGNFNLWNGGTTTSGSSTIAVQSSTVHDGKYAAEVVNNNGLSEAATTFSGGGTTADIRGYLNIASLSTFQDYLELATGSSGFIINYNSGTGKFDVWNGVTATDYDSSFAPSINTWYEVELDVTASATTGTINLYVNGTHVLFLTGLNTGTSNFSGVILGETSTGRAGTYYIDDVSVDTVQPGESANLNVDDSLHVAGSVTLGSQFLQQTAANSTTAFQVQNAGGTRVLNTDTTNSIVSVQGINSVAVVNSGTNLVGNGTNDDFTSGSYWTPGTGWNQSGTSATQDVAVNASGNLTSVGASIGSGVVYQITFTISGSVVNGVIPEIGGGYGQVETSAGTYTQYTTTNGTGQVTFVPSGGNFGGTISAVTVYSVTASNPVIQVLNSDASVGLEVRSGGTGLNNTFVGTSSGEYDTTGNYNTATGVESLQANTTGYQNTASGYLSLQDNTTGTQNTATGAQALQLNTTGFRNTAVGFYGLLDNTTGFSNTATGFIALQQNTTGNDNTAVGDTALYSNTTGFANTSIGSNTLKYSNGNADTAVGASALYNDSTGSDNTGVGGNALYSITAGSYDSALGFYAGFADSSNDGWGTPNQLSASTALGFDSQVQNSNSLTLGGQGNFQTNVGIGTTVPTNVLSVSPYAYYGDAYQSGNTITGIGTTWTSAMVGDQFVFGDTDSGTSGSNIYAETITGFTSTTSLTGSVSQTVASSGSPEVYRLQYPGLQVTSSGNVGIGTLAPTANLQVTTQANTTTAFQVQNASGTTLINTDTINNLTTIGSALTPLWQDGFESGSLGSYTVTGSPAPAIDTTTPHTGTYDVKFNETGSGANIILKTITATPTLSIREYVYLNSYAASGNDFIEADNGGTTEVETYLNSSTHYICVWINNISSSFCSTTVFPTGAYHKLEASYTTGANGTWAVYLDGSQVLSGTGNVGSGSFTKAGFGDIDGNNGALFYIDDVQADTFLGPLSSSLETNNLLTGGTATFASPTNSTNAFRVQNASGTAILNDDTTNTQLTLGNAGGALDAFQTDGASIPTAVDYPGMAYGNGHAYLVGGNNTSGAEITTVQMANINANGSLSWTTLSSTPLPVALRGAAVVVANGYLYAIGGETSFPPLSTVYYSKINADGTLAGWSTTTSVPTAQMMGGVTYSNGYIYVIGGDGGGGAETNTMYAQLNANGTIGSWTTGTNLGTAVGNNAVVAADGYIYSIGGWNGGGGGLGSSTPENITQYATINPNTGAIGSWSTTTNYSSTAYGGVQAQIANGYVYVMGGENGTTETRNMSYAAINTNGTLGTFTTVTNALPAARGFGGSFTANGYVYYLSGTSTNADSGATTTTYYASTPGRVQVNGSLDLVSGLNGTLGLPGTGGSLTAGNTSIIGTLNVQDTASFANNVSIAGNLSSAELSVSGTVPSSSLSLVSAGAGDYSLAVQGRYLYTTSTTNNDVEVYDVSNPASPSAEIGSVSTGASSSPSGIAIAGHYAYTANDNGTMSVIDISNPAAPILMSTTTVGSNSDYIAVQGRYVYIVNRSSSTVYVYDVSNPASPVKVSSFNTVGGGAVRNPYIQGQYLYLAGGASGDLEVYNIANPALPTRVGFVATGGTPYGVYVDGRYAYVTDNSSHLLVYDVSNPASIPSAVASFSTGASSNPEGVYVQGNYAYVADNGTGNIQVINISNPTNPVGVGTIPAGGGPNNLYVQGDYLYASQPFNSPVIYNVGGTYIQQLQTGGLETGTLQTDGNATINGDESVQGGLVVGSSIQTTGNLGAGDLTIAGLAQAGAPSISQHGTTGSGHYTYAVEAFNASGNSPASAPTLTTSGNSTAGLTSSNYNIVTWSAVTGATGYNIYRTAVSNGGAPTTTGLVGTVYGQTTVTYNDIGGAGDGTTAPTTYTAGALTAAGTALFDNSTNSTTAFQVQNASGQNLLTLNTTTGNNLVVNSGFETGAANWTSKGTSTVSQEQGDTLIYNTGTAGTSGSSTTISGSSTAWTSSMVGDLFEFANGQGGTITAVASGISLTISTAVTESGAKYQIISPSAQDGSGDLKAVASAATSGMQTSTFNSSILPSTQYQLTFWAMCSASITTFSYGRQDVSGTDVNSSTAATCNNFWTQYTTHYTTGGTITNPNIYMDSGTTASVGIYIDDVTLVQTTNTGPTAYTSGATNALQLQNSSGASLLTANTANMRVGVDATYTALSAPSGLAAAAGGTGTLSGTYYYKITAIDSVGGESLPSSEVSAAPSSQGVNLTWNTDIGASGYNIYRSTSMGGEVYITTVTGTQSSVTQLTYADNGSITAGTAVPPATNNAYVSTSTSQANGQLAIGGNGTPTGQLYVSGTVPSTALSTITTNGLKVAGIQVQGRYAYTLSSNSNNLQIIDYSNPAAPSIVSTTTTQSSPVEVAVGGDYAYVIEGSPTNALQIFNISNPASPFSVSSISAGTTPDWVYVSGRYAYVTNSTSLLVFDISNPAAPVQVGSTTNQIGSGADEVYVQGRYAYVTTQSGLIIYDISDPSAPTYAGTSSSTNSLGVVVQGRYAYVTENTGPPSSMEVIDISNPAAPVEVGTVDTDQGPGPIAVQGRYAYMVAGYGGAGDGSMQVIDVSNPASPFVVGSVNTLAAPSGIVVQGRYAYVNDYWGQAVQAFDLGGTYDQQLQAGGAEVGTLQVDTNANVYGDEAVEGGLTVGSSVQVAGNGTLGGLTISGLATVGTPTDTPTIGSPAGITYHYKVVAFNNSGSAPASAPTVNDTNGSTTLNGTTNKETITWSAVTGATGYNIYRTTAGGTGNSGTTGLIGTVYTGATLSFVDSGAAADGTTAPSITTAGLFQIQNGASQSLLNVDASNDVVNVGVTGSTALAATVNIGTSSGATETTNIGSANGANVVNIAAGTGNINLSTNSASASVIVKDSTANTTAFQVQNASGNGVLTVDTSGSNVNIGKGSALTGNLVFYNSSSAVGVTLNTQSPTGAGYSLSLPAAIGSVGQCLELGSGTASNLQYGNCNSATTNSTLQQAYAAAPTAIPSITVDSSGSDKGVTIQNSNANPITGELFGVQSRAASGLGTPIFSVSSTGETLDSTNNLANNPSVETAPSSSTDWKLKGTATIAQDSTTVEFGNNSLKITGAATNDGAWDRLNTTLTASTAYNLSFYVKNVTATSGTATIVGGYSIDDSIGSPAESVVCTNSVSAANGWAFYSCAFTTPASGELSTNAIFVKTTDATARTINVDGLVVQASGATATPNYHEGQISLQGAINSPLLLQGGGNSATALNVQNAGGFAVFNVDTTTYNLITDGDFELSSTGWSAFAGTGSGTISRDGTKSYAGKYSLNVSATAGTGGAQYSLNPVVTVVSQTYTVSFYALLNSGTAPTFQVTYDSTGSNPLTCSPTGTLITTGWTRFQCSIAANATAPTTGGFIRIAQTNSNTSSWNIDNVQMEQAAAATNYSGGNITLAGTIQSPVTFEATSNSTTAFQIQNSSGANAFGVDTANNIITLGTGTGANATLLVLGNKTDSGDPSTCTPGAIYYNSNGAADTEFRACRKNTAGTAGWYNLIAGVDVQDYTGNTTWTKPQGVSVVMVIACGGGGSGGGAAGGVASSSAREGGTGGGGGAQVERTLSATDLTSTVSVTVGAQVSGGGGGATANGSPGTVGNPSSFGTYVKAAGGGAGFDGTTTAANHSGGGGGGLVTAGSAGAAATVAGGENATTGAVGDGWAGGGSTTNNTGDAAEFGGGGGGSASTTFAVGFAGGDSIVGGGGGGGGGGVTAANAAATGGAGGGTGTFSTGGAANANAAGSAGNSTHCGTGGGGGLASTSTTGGVGGAGGTAGGGGGGGGGGTSTGGTGGVGGRGEVWVFSW